MNILYRACASRNGYQSRILKLLYDKGIFEKCTVITQSLDDRDDYQSDIYHEINAMYGYSCSYYKICDVDELPEVSEVILRRMEQYKAVALNMTCRNHHMHLLYYDEMEYEYMLHVKFWNSVLDNDHIDFVFLTTTPHCVWEYVIYALAKTKGIPVLIETVANIPGFNEVGTSLDNLGKNTMTCFASGEYNGMNQYVREYYDKVLFSKEFTRKIEKSAVLKEQKEWVCRLYYKPLVKRVFNKDNAVSLVRKLRSGNSDYNIRMHHNTELLMRFLVKKINYGNQNYYDKRIASKRIDYDKRYIYYALQYFPESSVLPRGGVFWNQLNAIKMLAHVAKKRGVNVLVKEHWIEESRAKRYYQELKSISGVYCVKSTEESAQLVENALAVASETGTCIQESIIKGKPVITFADHYMCGAPGVYRVHDENEIEKVLMVIMEDGYRISETDVEKYFEAISRTLVKGYLDWPSKPHINLRECIKDTVDLINRFVLEGMKEDFIYIKESID
ncbi:MAG: hypothetical protein K6E49_07130 [Lachnospiraceae bacterium]|nr:hypothetical protein [Lachnospiraceae bacterium]